jgi:predicted nuclease of predicted toxin-antitoxin system
LQPSTWFVVDAQLPPKLAALLTEAGYASVHCSDRLQRRASDPTVAALANTLGAFVMSKDEDFVDILGRGQLRTGLVWVRHGNLRLRQQCDLIEAHLPNIIARITMGEKLIEIGFP